jgi:hypothetical protein
MKKILKFLLIKKGPDMPFRHGYPLPVVFDRIESRFPEIVNGRRTSVEVAMEENDPKLAEIMNYLEGDLGLQALLTESASVKARQDDNRTFVVKTIYKFDEQDIENAKFLGMSSTVSMGIEGLGGTNQWGLVQAARKLPLIGYLIGGMEVCTAAAREELEKEGLSGLDFLPVAVHDSRYREDDFWQLWANRIMPKVTMPLCDLEGDPVRKDYSTGCMPEEIGVVQRVLKYRAADLAAMNDTDFAITTEKWGSPKSYVRREELLVSQRVRQWCLKKKVKADWTPVIAVPE